MRPIKTAISLKNISSYKALAERLMRRHPDVFSGDGRSISTDSLSTKIGELDRDDPTWWLNKSNAVQCLADFLDLDINDLNLKKKTGRHIFAPEVFPDFPPLLLVREEVWEIAEAKQLRNNIPIESDRYQRKPSLDYWLTPGAIGVSPGSTQWLYVSDNIEFDLLTRGRNVSMNLKHLVE